MVRTQIRQTLAPAAVALLLGLTVALQVKTQVKVEQAQKETRVTEGRVAQYIAVQKELGELRSEFRRVQEAASQQATAAQLQEELLIELASAGLVPVEGPGITVALADLGRAPTSTRQVALEDIMGIVNELKAAGAEAVAVNGQRVTPQFGLTRSPGVESRLLVSKQPINGPVWITAIGDPAVLTASLNMHGGVLQLLTPWLDVAVHEAQLLSVPGLEASPLFRYGRPRS